MSYQQRASVNANQGFAGIEANIKVAVVVVTDAFAPLSEQVLDLAGRVRRAGHRLAGIMATSGDQRMLDREIGHLIDGWLADIVIVVDNAAKAPNDAAIESICRLPFPDLHVHFDPRNNCLLVCRSGVSISQFAASTLHR